MSVSKTVRGGSSPSGDAKFGLIVITGAQWLCKPRVGVRFPVGPPNLFDANVRLLYNSMSRAGRTVMQRIANP